MGQFLVFSQNITELTKIALGPKKPNPVIETLDRLLAAASSQSYPITFLLCAFDHFDRIREEKTTAQVRASIRSLLKVLLEKTPEEVFLACPAMNEYLLVVPRLEASETLRFAMEIQTQLGLANAPTVSIACSSFPQQAHSRVSLLSQLRETISRLQRGGENQVDWWKPTPGQSVSTSVTPAMWERFQEMSGRLGIDTDALLQEALEDSINKYSTM